MFLGRIQASSQRVSRCCSTAPTLNYDELDNAYKALGLSYLGMREPMWQHSAAIVLKMATKTYIQREVELEEHFGVNE
jgi:hypothetical protein